MTLATILGETAAVVDYTASGLDVYIRDSAADTGEQPSPYRTGTRPTSGCATMRLQPTPTTPRTPSRRGPRGRPPDPHRRRAELHVCARAHGPLATPRSPFRFEPTTATPARAWRGPTTSSSWARSLCPAIRGPEVRFCQPFGWTPEVPDHECLLAIASGPGDPSIPDVYGGRPITASWCAMTTTWVSATSPPRTPSRAARRLPPFWCAGAGGSRRTPSSSMPGNSPADTAIQVRLLLVGWSTAPRTCASWSSAPRTRAGRHWTWPAGGVEGAIRGCRSSRTRARGLP